MAGPPPSPSTVKQDAWLKSLDKKKVNAATLNQYTKEKRLQEVVSVIVCSLLYVYMVYAFVRDVRAVFHMGMLPGLAFSAFLGLCFADFVSGVVHWGFDTWGSTETPFFGPFVRSFREHHVAPRAMCEHDFIQTNGDTFLVLIPGMVLAMLLATNVYSRAWGLAAVPFIAMTNECHKLAHEVPSKVPAFVRWMQDNRLVLSRAHHNNHHVPPHMESYCITTGWMNGVLNKVDFWRYLEGPYARLSSCLI